MTSQEFGYELKIPKERIAVLIGKKGKAKREIESLTKTKIKVDSREGDVFISGEDALSLFSTREVVKAVGRGFNPEVAKLLLKPDYILEVLNVEDYASSNNLDRVRGRIIGTEGKARKIVETLTGCFISVYGKTVAIIGDAEKSVIARRAVESLLRGAKHGNVYKLLEKRKKELTGKELIGGNYSI
jgi:ribosomal RNA assembly protein